LIIYLLILPYAEKVQYGELNFIWEAWLGFDTHWHDEEIIVNEVRGKTVEDWREMMSQAMAECYRVLKPGSWLSLCYHDTSEGTWEMVQDIMAEVGFCPRCVRQGIIHRYRAEII
jgi:DNA modification methylase